MRPPSVDEARLSSGLARDFYAEILARPSLTGVYVSWYDVRARYFNVNCTISDNDKGRAFCEAARAYAECFSLTERQRAFTKASTVRQVFPREFRAQIDSEWFIVCPSHSH